MNELSIDIESNDSKPHNGNNGNPITKIEISPNGNYLVTYSEKDKSVVGWNVDNTDEGQLKPDNVYNTEDIKELYQICVSDDKKLAYIYDYKLKIIDMNNNNQEINLYFDKDIGPRYCAFNLKGEFILYDYYKDIIWVYSTKTTKINKYCKKIYKFPFRNFNLISISKYDKFYLISNDDYCIYEWDIFTEKCVKIFGNDETKKYIEFYEDYYIRDVKISSNKEFICLKIDDKIIIYSIELEIPIISLNNNGTQLYNFMNYIDSDLYSLLLTLLNTKSFKFFNDKKTPSIGIWNPIMEYYCKEYLPKEYQTENLLVHPFLFDNTTKFVYRILDGYVWKIKIENIFKIRNKLDKWISEMIEYPDQLYPDNENDKITESWNIYLDNECDDHVNNTYVERKLTLYLNLKVNLDGEKIQLQVFKKVNGKWDEWDLICTSNDEHNIKNIEKYRIFGISRLYNDNDIIILTTIGILIYNFNESNKSISLNLFYHIILNQYHEEKIKKELQDYYKIVSSKPSLPSSSDDKDGIDKYNEWASSAKDNKLSLLKYGVELLSFVIKEHKLELIDDIYKKCINYFKQDLLYNRMFLSIITSTMPVLDEYYPEYILRYSLETTMIIDSSFYSIEHQNNEHLYSFSQYPQIVNLSRSILWTKYVCLHYYTKDNYKIIFIILRFIQLLISLLTFPIYFPTFYILSRYHFINNIYNNYDNDFLYYIYFKIFDKISTKFSKHTTTPTITFMVPYIKFVNYPQHYNRNWFWELIRPQSSPFVKTISRDIYKTWSGEALINFKWSTYGKYYYAIIWIIFMALFGCFTTAATITLVEDVRNKLLVASIIFGFIHLLTEVRQIIYDPKKWVLDLWNIFDIIAYLFPICTSIYWIKTNNMITWLLSFSCLFLYIKLVMFFRVFESFGVYFAIIISVGKQIISFLVVLLIIIMGFAHAFYILLLPRSDNDPNSPSNLTNTYNKVFDNGTIDDSNPFTMIQSPGDNTNMFVDYRTSILAMYLFLTGDSSSLTNWSYIKNPPLVILTVLFSFLVVVYLMNLFIGLLNIAIDKDNNRVSYLIQKAEILAEIELFYLLPNQRRWKAWFPDTIHCYANADKTRDKIKEMINNGEWKTNEFSEMKQDLLDQLNIQYNPEKYLSLGIN